MIDGAETVGDRRLQELPTFYVRDNGIGLALVKRIDTESLGAELPWRSGL
ncbi:MAG: hypothetical protein GY723_20120 [bacterium]|nr:hypothetical protein [bacterium]